MSVKEIVFVIVLVSAIILMIYFQIRITADKKSNESCRQPHQKPRTERIPFCVRKQLI